VVEESDRDLMGDGVNIAARLEGVLEPGGVLRLRRDGRGRPRAGQRDDYVLLNAELDDRARLFVGAWFVMRTRRVEG
jgi:hypothetical protein